MTKETKIGLLVGLAFIIVFAIILSEKGPSTRNSTLPAFSVVDSTRTGTGGAPSPQPLNNAGRLPVDAQLPPIVQPAVGANPNLPMREEEVLQPVTVAEGELPPLPDSVISLINGTLPAEQPVETASARNDSPVGESPIVAVQVSPTQLSSESTAAPPSQPQTTLASNDASSPTVLPASAQTKFLTIRTVHTVEKGESLGKIAAKYYERSTPARVEAIYEANRDTLSGVHSVKAGQKLKIPDLGEASSSFEPAPDFALSAEAPHSEPATTRLASQKDALIRIPIPIADQQGSATNPVRSGSDQLASRELTNTRPAEAGGLRRVPANQVNFRMYEVRPSDTLSGIARRELGSERFHNEIYKLNKDVLANKNSIKPGMKLRLPVPSASAADARTVLSSNGLGSGD